MTDKSYEKPMICKTSSKVANTFGHRRARQIVTEIEGVGVSELLADFGSPLMVFSERVLRHKYREAHQAFATRYPKVRLCWSYKTNYLDAVCRIFHQEGAWAEVVSEMEYDMARRLGVPGSQIIYNGPYKPLESLRRALAEGARVQLDSFDELAQAEQVAGAGERRPEVSLRVNLDAGIYPRWDRFGFNFENGDALQAAKQICTGGRLQLDGLHCHIGTFILDPQAYAVAARKLAELANQIVEQTGMKIRFLNLGGGFVSRATLHTQYGPSEDSAPTFDDYATAICDAMLETGVPPGELPTLLFESGRAMVDDAGTMLCRAVASKRLADGSASLVVDAGLNILFTSLWYRHEVFPAVDRGDLLQETVVHGPLCMNIDVVHPSALLPALEPGDPLVIRPVGAYNVTQWMQFIQLRPAVVLIGQQGEVDLIRKPETVTVVKQPELLPDRLSGAPLRSLEPKTPTPLATYHRRVPAGADQPEPVNEQKRIAQR
jgi:diaminopimelate decarboxylase